MKDSLNLETIRSTFAKSVLPTYGRFDIAFVKGAGCSLWDSEGTKYLDLSGGIAVCSLGHANSELADILAAQARELWHVSNLFYHVPQGELAAAICARMDLASPAAGGGKAFFCNSGAEANEALCKLARKFGHDTGRYEVLTATNSFHGRTLATVAATGQDKIKIGFEPMVDGFRSVPFNDLAAMEQAISPKTIAILVEGIQGEGGIIPAKAEYLLGLRKLCDERGILLFMDTIQCGMYRSGRFQSYQRILEGHPDATKFFPDAISMAKGLGGGFPIGAIWVRAALTDTLTAGSHGTTFGGNLLACSVALGVLNIIERDGIEKHVRTVGEKLIDGLKGLQQRFPNKISAVRGLGLMIGIEVVPESFPSSTPGKTPAAVLIASLLQEHVVTVGAGPKVVRMLPALTISEAEIDAALDALGKVLEND